MVFMTAKSHILEDTEDYEDEASIPESQAGYLLLTQDDNIMTEVSNDNETKKVSKKDKCDMKSLNNDKETRLNSCQLSLSKDIDLLSTVASISNKTNESHGSKVSSPNKRKKDAFECDKEEKNDDLYEDEMEPNSLQTLGSELNPSQSLSQDLIYFHSRALQNKLMNVRHDEKHKEESPFKKLRTDNDKDDKGIIKTPSPQARKSHFDLPLKMKNTTNSHSSKIHSFIRLDSINSIENSLHSNIESVFKIQKPKEEPKKEINEFNLHSSNTSILFNQTHSNSPIKSSFIFDKSTYSKWSSEPNTITETTEIFSDVHDDGCVPNSQHVLGSEDQHLQELGGVLDEVCGPHSILTQEMDNHTLKRSSSFNSNFTPHTSMLQDNKYTANKLNYLFAALPKKTERKSNMKTLIESAKIVENRERKRPLEEKASSSQNLHKEYFVNVTPTSQISSSLVSPSTSIIPTTKKEKPRSRKRTKPSISILTTAEKAASLSRSILNNPSKAKQLLLRMALVRENPRNPRKDPPRGTTIPNGFFWGAYPSLENILRKHMKKYYDLSTNKRQSRAQQEYNNELVTLVREEAARKGWKFDESEFNNYRKIRDRIRCFFKTHIQNSKKRLNTMLKNPEKRANALALVKHMDLMDEENKVVKNLDVKINIKKENIQESDLVVSENDIDDDGNEECAQDPNRFNVDESTHDAAQKMIALGFGQLSQDSQLRTS